MDFLTARQPILDVKGGVIGYELLFRAGVENAFPEVAGDVATSNLIMDNFILNNVSRLTHGKLAFVNLTENLLCDGYAQYLPSKDVVIELLETVPASEQVIGACRALRAKGYRIALDDFVLEPDDANAALIEHCDFIKVDFLACSPAQRQEIIGRVKGRNIELIAEKIETPEHHRLAINEGFDYFQGYFFAVPELVKGEKLSGNRFQQLRLIEVVTVADPDIDKVVEAIQCDVALTYKLLRCINSAAFGVRREVRSIRQAVVYIGFEQLRQWVCFLALADLCDDRSPELIRTALMRAHLSDRVVRLVGEQACTDDPFLIGMFSLIDAMLNRSMIDIVAELPLSASIKQALLGLPHPQRPILDLVMALERGDWESVEAFSRERGIAFAQLAAGYVEAVEWVDQAVIVSRARPPRRRQ